MAFMVTSLWGLYVGQSFHTVGKPASDNDGVKAVLTQGEGVAEVIESGGRRYLYGFTSLGELPSKTDLHLNLRIPAEVALADATWGLRRNLIALICVGLLALGAWLRSVL
jgi:hypothetical protein